MNESLRTLRPARVLIFIGLYLVLSYLAIAFIKAPGDVTLMWPAAGLALAFLLRYGLAWSLPLALSVLLVHVLFNPMPAVFVPFSILSNVTGTALALVYIRARHPDRLLSMQGGFSLVQGACLLAVVSALIGCAGLYLAGMLDTDALWPAFVQWALGDLAGIICVGPAALLLTSWPSRDPDTPHPADYSGLNSRMKWSVLFLLSLLLIFLGGRSDSPYVLGLAMLPVALVIWSAIRYPPAWTASANAVSVIAITSMIGLGLGGFQAPASLMDTVYLLVFISLMATFPMMMMASNHESRKAARKLFRRASTDPGTNLPNRIAFEEAAREVLEGDGPAQTLVYLDFDHFTLINDTVSHAAGDVLISSIASMLQASLQGGEQLFRIGGDEFTLLLPVSDKPAERRTQQLVDAIETFRTGWNGHMLSTTASAGIVGLVPGRADFAQALSQADAACFTAKELGGNRVCVADQGSEAMQSRAESMQWAIRIRGALSRNEFDLYCQEVRSLKPDAGKGLDFEILLRLRDPHSGKLLSPGLFMPSAERYDLGTRIDRHVVDLVFAWMEAHPAEARSVSSCSINLSAGTMQDAGFAAFLRRRLANSAFPAHKVIFEITETSAVLDVAHAQALIADLRRLGCRFALDDFGSGFCSFQYLQSLDVDMFKIDGSFIRDLGHSPLSQSVVRAITNIAGVLNKTTVAEHCESEAQLAVLEQLGVDRAQGFVIHRPEAIADYFRRHA